ncbi:hypothetical protein MSAN_02050600 [Mycena sanguinolenta]|uniref:Uncharacterized protein n=1 Tax=Mycena sanguinolenta TaxID=230812 RepID=A0A8H6XK47_9AGAR|nr:hypothetical protein MSAN_02050600 [Mycena sanguinolenta]
MAPLPPCFDAQRGTGATRPGVPLESTACRRTGFSARRCAFQCRPPNLRPPLDIASLSLHRSDVPTAITTLHLVAFYSAHRRDATPDSRRVDETPTRERHVTDSTPLPDASSISGAGTSSCRSARPVHRHATRGSLSPVAARCQVDGRGLFHRQHYRHVAPWSAHYVRAERVPTRGLYHAHTTTDTDAAAASSCCGHAPALLSRAWRSMSPGERSGGGASQGDEPGSHDATPATIIIACYSERRGGRRPAYTPNEDARSHYLGVHPSRSDVRPCLPPTAPPSPLPAHRAT